MNILTDEEIHRVRWSVPVTRMSTDDDYVSLSKSQMEGFARAIEAAVLSKLAEQAGEPVAWMCWLDGDTEMNPSDAAITRCEPTAYKNRANLYTEAQLIANQQRMAEACAKVCDQQAKEPECPERATYCAEAIRNNWREYL